jgi:hypothetical protein
MKRLKLIAALGCVVVAVLTGCGKSGSLKHGSLYEKEGGFSYDPPAGWQIVEFPGYKYRISRGPTQNDFAPNINVVDEKFSGPLSAYVDANVETLQKLFKNLTILQRESFTTTSGSAGFKLVTKNEPFGQTLRQTFYFFANGNRKYVVTCSALAEGGETLDAIFQESIRTFRMH